MLTPEEFAERMKALAEDAMRGDEESAHRKADNLMTALLTELGYGEGVSVFDEMYKWYA